MPRQAAGDANRYAVILERVFLSHYRRGRTRIEFHRDELIAKAAELGIDPPRNLGDLIYSFRYRVPLPQAIQDRAPEGMAWVIRPAGRSRYAFTAVDPESTTIVPNETLTETKIPNATPGVIAMYALSDEQALLAILRYNRLIDVFTGVSCYSLQSHLRSTVPGMGQVETDEVYVGIDRRGAHYVFPVQAKGGRDTINVVQIEQDIGLCAAKFENAYCRPIAAQFMDSDLIALFEFELLDGRVRIASERHYRLVEIDELSPDEVRAYGARIE